MRKFVLLLGFVILAVSIFSILFDFGFNLNSGFAVNGSFDLSASDYRDLPVTALRGTWEFYPSASPTGDRPGELERGVPLNITESWKGIPSDGGTMGSFGYGAYRLQLTLPEPGYYSLAIDNVYTAYTLFVNGHPLLETGTFATTKEEHYPQFTDKFVTFHTNTNTADIVIYVSNFTHPTPGFGKAPLFGIPYSLHRIVFISHSTSLFIVGVLMMMALFMTFYYNRSNRDSSIIFFSAMCALLALRTVTTNTLISIYLPWLPTALQLKIEYLTITVTFIMFLLYSRSAFPHILQTVILRILLALASIFSLAIIILPIRLYNYGLVPFLAVLAAAAVYWLISLFFSWFRKEQTSGIILFGGFILALAVLNDIIYYTSGMTNLFAAELSAFGLTFFIITNSYEFSYKFLTALKLSRETSHELERRIQTRTRQLSELNGKLLRMATRDDLTDLWNRNEFQRRSEEETAKYNRYYASNSAFFSVLYLDLDNFKYYNDTFTHEAGDRVLRLFADSLKQLTRSSDTLFRMGGDEFVIFLPKTDNTGAAKFAQRITDSMESFNDAVQEEMRSITGKPVSISRERKLTCSIGIAVHAKGFINIARLIQYADAALLRAKEEGKNRYILHSGSMF